VQNIGLDGSGENCGQVDLYKSNFEAVDFLNMPKDIVERSLAVDKIKEFYIFIRPSLPKRCIRRVIYIGEKIKNYICGYNDLIK